MVVELTHNDAILTATLSFIMEKITCSSAQIADEEYTYQDQEGPYMCILQLSRESRLKINED
jgi:hypothetical protein